MVSTPFTVVTNSLMTMVIPPDVVVAFPSAAMDIWDKSVITSEGIETEVEEDDVSDAEVVLVVVLESEFEQES